MITWANTDIPCTKLTRDDQLVPIIQPITPQHPYAQSPCVLTWYVGAIPVLRQVVSATGVNEPETQWTD